jgi:hypothetical protein
LIQDCPERLFFGWWVRVVYVGRHWSMREIAFWLWAILLADIERHCVLGATDVLEVLVVLHMSARLVSSCSRAVYA